jgi:cellobiose epimerase
LPKCWYFLNCIKNTKAFGQSFQSKYFIERKFTKHYIESVALFMTLHNNTLIEYQQQLKVELQNILDWWITHSLDEQQGGFYGQIDHNNLPNLDAPKGLVLNARILWTFAAATTFFNDDAYGAIATRAYDYCIAHFWDNQYGGCYWALDAKGKPLHRRKQIYGLAFMLYGLSEYYRSAPHPMILKQAIDLYEWIEKYSFDAKNGGYFEAFTENGEPLNELRLSPKDRNDPKTMNTHLHILEAYTNLYRIWKNDELKQQIEGLIDVFLQYFIHPERKTLILFFDNNWQPQDSTISYGHDIEASWLLYEAAEAIGYKVAIISETAIAMAKAALQGFDSEGALLYENHRLERHWWVQAEAMIGYFNAFQLSNDLNFLDKSLRCWQYTQNNMIDRVKGEWYWGFDNNNLLMANEDKAGFWKCPYHNSRACIEIIRRICLVST